MGPGEPGTLGPVAQASGSLMLSAAVHKLLVTPFQVHVSVLKIKLKTLHMLSTCSTMER